MDQLARVLKPLISPFFFLLAWIVLVTIYLVRKGFSTRRSLALLVIPVALLAVTSTPLVSHYGLATLEWHYPLLTERPRQTQAIVILSGGARPADAWRPTTQLTADTMIRCRAGARFYHSAPPCPVVVSGGPIKYDAHGTTLAAAMRKFLIELGVAEQDVWLEPRSNNTHQNAAYCRSLLSEHDIDTILLVTHASHLPRAVACFRAQGMKVVPAGCGHLSTTLHWEWTTFLPSAGNAYEMKQVCREWVGLVWYRLTGRI